MTRSGVGLRELERRWKEVRKEMEKRGLDWIVCEGTFGRLGGYPRWFTDRTTGYNTIIAFPIEGDLLYASHVGGHHPPADSFGVKNIGGPICQTYYANTVAPWVVNAIKQRKPARIGIAGYGTLSTASYLALTKGLPESEFVDATDLVDGIKAVKSEEEVRCIRKTAETHDEAIDVALGATKPGKTPSQVSEEIMRFMLQHGSAEWIHFILVSPPGEPTGPYSHTPIKDGWTLDLLLEFNGPDGYYNELGRKTCVGRAPNEMEEVQADVIEAQAVMAKRAVPGAHPVDDVLEACQDFMREKGYPEEDRTAGHGQGYDLMERPAFSVLGETIRLKAGMVVSIHPTCRGKKYVGWICDDFLITETGAKRIHHSPQGVLTRHK